YAPPSVLVNSRDEVVHYSAFAHRYFRIPGGHMTHDVVRLIREPLSGLVADGLEEAHSSHVPWHSGPVSIDQEYAERPGGVRIDPVHIQSSTQLWLIVLDELQLEALPNGARVPAAGVAQLEADLTDTHQRLYTLMYGLDEALPADSGPNAVVGANTELRRVL